MSTIIVGMKRSPSLNSKGIHGEIASTREIRGFTLTKTTFEPGLRLKKHSHENAHFCLLLKGEFTEQCGTQRLDCKPMSLSFLAASADHADHFCNAGAQCFIIDVAPHWIEHARTYSLAYDECANHRGGLLSALAFKMHNEFLRNELASSLAIEGIALELLAEAARPPININNDRIPPVWLVQARDILHERFSETLSHTEIADLVDLHPIHLAREFRRYYHCSIGQYIRKLRIDFACLELATSNLSLDQIAHAAGFFDQSHFTRTFKTHMGVTPGTYRTLVRSR